MQRDMADGVNPAPGQTERGFVLHERQGEGDEGHGQERQGPGPHLRPGVVPVDEQGQPALAEPALDRLGDFASSAS